jgi:SET domain-containing protein
MLQIKTKLDKSSNHGIGLFADQFIKKGTVTWKYTPEFDVSYDKEQVDKMPSIAKKRFLDFSYFDFKINKYILCFDDQRFINHSKNPNISSKPEIDIANRDIQKGEELTCNYEDYEQGWFKNRKIKKSLFEKSTELKDK